MCSPLSRKPAGWIFWYSRFVQLVGTVGGSSAAEQDGKNFAAAWRARLGGAAASRGAAASEEADMAGRRLAEP